MTISCTPDSVNYLATLTYIHPDDHECAVRATLSWHRSDPAAVAFAVETNNDWVEWFFARSLLREGVDGGVGCGDVRIRPIGPGVIGISLSNQSGQADFAADRVDLGDFLAATYLRLPEGYEFHGFDWEAELRALLTDGPTAYGLPDDGREIW